MILPFEGYLKRKEPREAADVGLVFWRENFVYFVLFFAIPFWVCAFALRMLPENLKYYSWLILWFLKPLFDRPVLHIISVRFFEPDTDVWRFLRGLGKSLWRGLLGDLFWRRFSPYRAAIMPIYVLESHKNNRNNTAVRKELLMKKGLRYNFFITIWGILLEIALLVGEILFIFFIFNLSGKEIFSFTRDFILAAEIYVFAAWCFNYMLVETLYVCMGFSLYINSRIEVEGWDIEILFRSFAEKHKKKKLNSSFAALCLVISCFILIPVATHADEQKNVTTAQLSVPLEKLHEILDSPDFGGESDAWAIRFKNTPRERNNNFSLNFSRLPEMLRVFFAVLLRVIIFAVFILLAVYLYIYASKFINYQKSKVENSSVSVFHGASKINPQKLLDIALDFYKNENQRMAWGCCTAAIILSLSFYRKINFPPNATENDCVKIAKAAVQTDPLSINESEFNAFEKAINNWINFAYGGYQPPSGSFEEAVEACRQIRSSHE